MHGDDGPAELVGEAPGELVSVAYWRALAPQPAAMLPPPAALPPPLRSSWGPLFWTKSGKLGSHDGGAARSISGVPGTDTDSPGDAHGVAPVITSGAAVASYAMLAVSLGVESWKMADFGRASRP